MHGPVCSLNSTTGYMFIGVANNASDLHGSLSIVCFRDGNTTASQCTMISPGIIVLASKAQPGHESYARKEM